MEIPTPEVPDHPPPFTPPPLEDFCEQFWLLFHKKNHLVLSNSIQLRMSGNCPEYENRLSFTNCKIGRLLHGPIFVVDGRGPFLVWRNHLHSIQGKLTFIVILSKTLDQGNCISYIFNIDDMENVLVFDLGLIFCCILKYLRLNIARVEKNGTLQ